MMNAYAFLITRGANITGTRPTLESAKEYAAQQAAMHPNTPIVIYKAAAVVEIATRTTHETIVKDLSNEAE